MNDLVVSAADVLVPFLATGAAAVAAGTAQEAGAELYKSATSVIAKIRCWLRGTGRADVEAALHVALDEGVLSMADLRALYAAYEASRGTANVSIATINAKNSIVGNVRIERFEA